MDCEASLKFNLFRFLVLEATFGKEIMLPLEEGELNEGNRFDSNSCSFLNQLGWS